MIDLPYAPPALPEQAIPLIWEKSLNRRCTRVAVFGYKRAERVRPLLQRC